MPRPPSRAVVAILLTTLCLSACRSASHHTTICGNTLQSDPSLTARDFFNSHYHFYCEDPSLSKARLTPRFFGILKHHYDASITTGQVGALDCDPWINAQDGDISDPFSFKTLKNHPSEAIVRFDYTLALGPRGSLPQSVLMKFQRSSSIAGWQLADLITPNNQSLIHLLERNP